MLPKYLGDLDNHTNRFLSSATIASMASVQLAGDSDSEDNDNGDDEDDEVEDDDTEKDEDDEDVVMQDE